MLRKFESEAKQRPLDQARRNSLQTAAATSVALEMIEAQVIAGKAKFDDTYIRLERIRRRAFHFGQTGHPVDVPADHIDVNELEQYLADKAKQKSNPRKGVLLEERQ